jgi:hypothetical protein
MRLRSEFKHPLKIVEFRTNVIFVNISILQCRIDRNSNDAGSGTQISCLMWQSNRVGWWEIEPVWTFKLYYEHFPWIELMQRNTLLRIFFFICLTFLCWKLFRSCRCYAVNPIRLIVTLNCGKEQNITSLRIRLKIKIIGLSFTGKKDVQYSLISWKTWKEKTTWYT